MVIDGEIGVVFEEVHKFLKEQNHPLCQHEWFINGNAQNYRQVSVFPDGSYSFMHYELMKYTNGYMWEFHPEGNRASKMLMKTFVYNFTDEYKRVHWKPSITGKYTSGEFFKITPKQKIKINPKTADYKNQIEELGEQFMRLYSNTNDSLIDYLKKNPILHDSDISIKINQSNTMSHERNTILYGPPGTGKTFNTANLALEICGINSKDLDRSEAKLKFDEFTEQGRIVFTTFHQSISYEDFIEGIKPVMSEDGSKELQYEIKDGLFKQLSIEAAFTLIRENRSKQSDEVLDFAKAYVDLAEEFADKIESGEIAELESRNGGKVEVDSISQHGNIIIKHVGGGRTYTVSKSRLSDLHKAIINLDDVSNIHDHFRSIIGGSNSSAYWAVLNAVRLRLKQSKHDEVTTREYNYYEKKGVVNSIQSENYKNKQGTPYVIVIDEINRGNISAIFGELITLIEEDKRIGSKNELRVTLPYSKEKFGVPSNLYIIGTMNTADRSVEALDTALRRRFSFVEMMPDPELLKDEKGQVLEVEATNGNILLPLLLKTINERIEVLVDRDHTIGHAYFMQVRTLDDLKNTFHKNIIPLLQEYFYGNYEKMELVLGEAFFEKTKRSTVKFAAKNSEFSFDGEAYRIRDISKMGADDFSNAIVGLLNGEVES